MTGLILTVRLEGDEAGERCDEGADAADIYTEKELAVVVGELRAWCYGSV